jgi:hypothetical protein
MNVDVVVCTKNSAKSMKRGMQQIADEIPFKNLIVIYGSSADGTKDISEEYTGNVFWARALEAGLAGCNIIITGQGSTKEHFRD